MQTITAFFDDRTSAEEAVAALTAAGISSSDIRMVEGNDPSASTSQPRESKGFFEAIGDFLMPDEDRYSYAEGLSRGGYLVTVQAASGYEETVIDILDNDGSVNMDERTESWRSEGWSGSSSSSSASGSSSGMSESLSTGAMGGMAAAASSVGSSSSRTSTDTTGLTGSASGTTSLDANNDGVIEVVEEELRIGKRDVSHGRVRVRAYTVEDKVAEDVSLRSETVNVVRRPVDREITNADAVFTDQTIEVEETAEEAVVSKVARVKEEIDISKTAETATETVSGTVRRTEVEIEDGRTGTTGRGTAAAETTVTRDDDAAVVGAGRR